MRLTDILSANHLWMSRLNQGWTTVLLSAGRSKVRTYEWATSAALSFLCIAFALPTAQAMDAGAAEQTRFWGMSMRSSKGTWAVDSRLGAFDIGRDTLHSLAGGEQGEGVLLSPAFAAPEDKIRLMVRGWSGSDGEREACYVELVDVLSETRLRHAPAPLTTDHPREVVWDTADIAGRKVRIRLTDRDSAESFAWIALDGIDAGQAFSWDAAEGCTLDGWVLATEEASPESEAAWLEGLPYLNEGSRLRAEGAGATLDVGGARVRRLYLFGMSHTTDIGTLLWHYPSDYSMRFFAGDALGDLVVHYSDGRQEAYPLVLGDTLFWSDRFHNYPEPFASDEAKQEALASAMRLYPATPLESGFRMGFIELDGEQIDMVELRDLPEKGSVPIVEAVTLETLSGDTPAGEAVPLEAKPYSASLARFLETHAITLCPEDRAERIHTVRNLLYTTMENLPDELPLDIPDGYRGPNVLFEGDRYADILTNAFYHNLADMQVKADPSGLYRESSPYSASYGGYVGFGTFSVGPSPYRDDCWSRGAGRALQEFLAFGYQEETSVCMDWCFEQARLWDAPENDHLRWNGVRIPAHWSRNLAYPVVGEHLGVFENDGHGMLMLVAYNVWRRLQPDERENWTRRWWDDIVDAAEWIIWQFENPEVFGTGDVLRTDSECNYMIGVGLGYGYSIYADYPCMEGLLRFAEIADDAGEDEAARRWREWASHMERGINKHYVQGDGEANPKAWTLWHSGWAYQSALLAPLIFLPDTRGMLPEDDRCEWRAINEASFQRLIDKWAGNGDPSDEWWYLPHEVPLYEAPSRHFPVRGNYSVAMGYGQAFVTQAALLLDRMDDAEPMIEWTARAIYDADYEPFIVPEGVETCPDGTAWFRTGDLGNGFQQAETMKTIRLLLGIDDTQVTQLRLVPRMPGNWRRMSVEEFPAWVDPGDGVRRYELQYTLERHSDGMSLSFQSDQPLPPVAVRLGPLGGTPKTVSHNGEDIPFEALRSGDSKWVRLDLDSGLTQGHVRVLW